LLYLTQRLSPYATALLVGVTVGTIAGSATVAASASGAFASVWVWFDRRS
jgi:hypothetical protein